MVGLPYETSTPEIRNTKTQRTEQFATEEIKQLAGVRDYRLVEGQTKDVAERDWAELAHHTNDAQNSVRAAIQKMQDLEAYFRSIPDVMALHPELPAQQRETKELTVRLQAVSQSLQKMLAKSSKMSVPAGRGPRR